MFIQWIVDKPKLVKHKTKIMKKILMILILSSVFIACKHKSESETSKDLILMNDGLSNSYLSDTGIVSTASMRSGAEEVEVVTKPNVTSPKKSSSNSGNSNSGTVSSGSSNSSGTSTQTTQKKGISKAAKGAIIGGVGGAAAGAVIG